MTWSWFDEIPVVASDSIEDDTVYAVAFTDIGPIEMYKRIGVFDAVKIVNVGRESHE